MKFFLCEIFFSLFDFIIVGWVRCGGPHLGGGGRVVESRGRNEGRSEEEEQQREEEEEEEERLDSIGGLFVSAAFSAPRLLSAAP